MPRITKAEQTRMMLKKKAEEEYAKNPPYSESNKNTEYYHSHEMKGLKDIRLALERVLYDITYQTENYEYSEVLISKEIRNQIGALTNRIYDEELTRNAAQQPTEHSFIALKPGYTLLTKD
jgi:hypothetical protein